MFATKPLVAVCSPSFGRDARLRALAEQDLGGAWELTYWDRHAEPEGAELLRFLAGARVAIVGKSRVDAALLAGCPELAAIAKYGVGLDNIRLDAAAEAGVAILHRAGVNAASVAEASLGLMLAVMRKIAEGDRLLRAGQWRKDGGLQLSGRGVAVIGCGAVGSQLAQLLAALACPLYLCDLVDKSELARAVGGKLCSWEEALSSAEVVSLHVPLTALTRQMVNEKSLQSFRRGSILINTSRGGVVDLEAVKAALRTGQLWGLGLDVFPEEPVVDPELWTLGNVVGTPHSAANSDQAVWAMGKAAVLNIQEWALHKK